MDPYVTFIENEKKLTTSGRVLKAIVAIDRRSLYMPRPVLETGVTQSTVQHFFSLATDISSKLTDSKRIIIKLTDAKDAACFR